MKTAPISYTVFAMCSLGFAFVGGPQQLWLWPFQAPQFELWQLITYAFVHAGWLHYVLNALALISFAPYIEREWGSRQMLLFCAAATVFAGAIQVTISDRPVVGASGLLFGVFVAYAWMRPSARLVTLFGFSIKTWVVAVVYVAFSAAAWLWGFAPGVAHAAHLGGAAIGSIAAAGFHRLRLS